MTTGDAVVRVTPLLRCYKLEIGDSLALIPCLDSTGLL